MLRYKAPWGLFVLAISTSYKHTSAIDNMESLAKACAKI